MDIDPDVANWVLEFLLRQSLEDRALNSLLRALPPPNDNLNIKKMLLLKKLESDISHKSDFEGTLELLEHLEEVEFLLGNETPSETMKQAFCSMAVECTVKHLKAGDGEDKVKRYNFFKAVRSIWMGKVQRMKELVERGGLGSEALWTWEDEIEAALWDDDAANRIMKKSEGVNVVEAVKAYIREEREKMGPSFLELVAERAKDDEILQGILGIGGIDQVAAKETQPSVVNEVAGESNANKEMNKEKIKLREKHVGLRRPRGLASRNHGGPKIVDPDETTDEPSHKKYKVLSSAEVHKAREALELSSLELKAVVKDPHPDALKIAQAISNEARNIKPQPPAAGDYRTSSSVVAQAPRGNTRNEPRPSLMERNNTARTWQWDELTDDESQEGQFGRPMPRLPSPRRINTSPLNQYQIVNLKKRRKTRKWSLQEEDTLRAEVDKYGKGNWKLILNLNRDTFQDRTEVDLKDKWRNMTS